MGPLSEQQFTQTHKKEQSMSSGSHFFIYFFPVLPRVTPEQMLTGAKVTFHHHVCSVVKLSVSTCRP